MIGDPVSFPLPDRHEYRPQRASARREHVVGPRRLGLIGAPGQQPYALRFLSDGRQPWFSYWGSNKIATINPDTLEVKEFVLPDSKTRIRRMGVTSDDMIWYGDWSNGKLSRFDPKTGAVKFLKVPGGEDRLIERTELINLAAPGPKPGNNS